MPPAEAPAPANFSPELLPALLDLSLTGIVLYEPVRDASGAVVDLAFAYLNPAAQRMLRLPARPAATFLAQFPAGRNEGFAFHRDTFLGDAPGQFDVNYQADGYDNYFRIAARRVGGQLLVSFTDTADQPRTAVEEALRASQAREQTARAEAQRQRRQLDNVLMQAPAMICVLEGPSHRFQFVNGPYQGLVGRRPLLGLPIAEAMPELAGQPIFELLDGVYRTGEPFFANEMLVQLDHDNSGAALGERYYNFTYQARRDLAGAIDGILVFAYEVTVQVLARRTAEASSAQAAVLNEQLDGLNEELAATNEELQATNEEFLASNTALARTQQTLEATNRALLKAARRAADAQATAEAARAELARVFEQAPVAIAILEGPAHVVALANPEMGLIWGRSPALIIGRPHFEALPDLAGQGFEAIFADVLRTGHPYYLREQPVHMDRTGDGQPTLGYFHIAYQPLRDGQGQISGITASAADVTAQVLARQQVQNLNEELAAINEELRASNEELLVNNAALAAAQQALGALNQELEARVARRTGEVRAALAEAEQQREQLRVQQGLLRQILRQMPAAIATLTGPQHRYTFFNDQYRALAAGRTQLGRTVAEVLPEVAAQGFVNLLDEVYRTGQPFVGVEMPIQLHDARTGQTEQRYLDFAYQPLFDGQDQLHGILAFIVDATEKVLARQQLDALQAKVLAAAQRRAAEREALYQVFEQTPAAVLLLRESGHRIEYFNPAYGALFPGRLVPGQALAEALPELVEQAFVALLDEVYRTGQPYVGIEVPMRFTPAPGQPAATAYFNFNYQPYREGDAVVGISVFAYDVTEQVQARQQREAQQRELRRVFEQAPVAICVFRGPHYVLDVLNPLMAQMLGHPLAQLLGRPFAEALPEMQDQGLPELLAEVWRSGQPFVAVERPVQLNYHAPGAPGHFNFVYEPLRDEQGQVVAITCVAVDATDQVRARAQVQTLNEELAAINKELRATNDRLSRTNADLDTFVYTASHDLKAPIANIEGLLEALREQLPPAALQAELVPRLLAMMQGAVERFQQTLVHLTDVSKLQLAQAEPPEPVDLPALAEAIRLDLAPLLTDTRATLLVDLAAVPTVSFSPKNLRSILYNLLSNAAKYHAPDRPPVVALRAYRDAGWVLLEVEDNGLGLSPEQQGRLFGMFQRLHDHVEGSGVGLYTVKKIVENAGGTIAVRSQPGVGSTFTVTLPG
ncbi:PAS domain-containing protein [Hymenobacter nivis]|uniref:histidine kinase n=1 Tax=Hymenobacter nivis TaxID=1850093 RepID=A0A502GAK3_9BACT|nr:PAS domain-containing protein [Hymenobacter nivis]TPG58701.1 PAS domain-containing protein [Hymenobacter nivis]